MDHRYNPEFRNFVAKQARWGQRHTRCLFELAHRRQGEHVCSTCGRHAVLDRLLATLTLQADRQADVKVNLRAHGKAKSLAYTCACGVEQTCACPPIQINYQARLIDMMDAAKASSVAQADVLVAEMNDRDVAAYGTLRDEFLKKQTIQQRSIERVRKAAADERTSQGGEVVYFVGSADGKIKIGTSANIEKRFDALQTAASVKLTLLLTIPGGSEVETELHRRFANLRETGEWFEGTAELRHFIEGAAFYKAMCGTLSAPTPTASTSH